MIAETKRAGSGAPLDTTETRRRGASRMESDGPLRGAARPDFSGFVRVRGAREHNLKNVDLEIPRRRPGRLHGRLRLGQIVAGVRHALRRGAAAIPRIRLALCPAAVPPAGRARGRRDRRPAAGRGPAAAARLALHPLVGRQRHDALEPPADALLAGRRLPARPADPLRRVVLAQHPRGGVPRVPRAGPGLRGHRAVDGAGRLADDPRAGRRRLADRLARAEPARDPDDARLRRRPPLARPAAEGPRLDPLHRRAADRAGLLGLHRGGGEAGARSGRTSRATRGRSPAPGGTCCTPSPPRRAR